LKIKKKTRLFLFENLNFLFRSKNSLVFLNMASKPDDNSSDDDVPISSLSNKKEQKVEIAPVKNEDESDEEDNIPISALKPKESPLKRKSTEESDDDQPLSQLAKSAKSPTNVKLKDQPLSQSSKSGNSASKVKLNVTTTPTKHNSAILNLKKQNSVNKKSKTTSTQKSKSSADVEVESKDATTISGLYKRSTKGELVKRLLCRWWYAIEWPHPSAILEQPPKGYEPLDGFPGVYVCVKGPKIGALLDNRDESTSPCFSNLIQKSTAELKELLASALENQRKALREAEGSNKIVETQIDKDLKFLKDVKDAKSDAFAKKLENKANKLRGR